MTQAELAMTLANRHGIVLDPSAVARLEKGRRTIRLNEAIALADILHLDLTELPPLPAVPPDQARKRLRELDRELEALLAEEITARASAREARERSLSVERRGRILRSEHAALERMLGVPRDRRRYMGLQWEDEG